MKHRIVFPIVLLAAISLPAASVACIGVWEDEMPITQDAAPQDPSRIDIAPDDTIYVLWLDWTVWEDTKVGLMKSIDKGHTWTEPAVIFEGGAFVDADICADEYGVHVIIVKFTEGEEGEYQIPYYARSEDGGVTFSDLVRLGECDNVGTVNVFSKDGILIAHAQHWGDDPEGPDNYLFVSEDGGDTWAEKLIAPQYIVQHPGLTMRDGVIHAVFGGTLGSPEISYSCSVDLGDTWKPPVTVSQGAGNHSQLPQVAVDDHVIHVAWEDDRAEHLNIMYSQSTDGGATWSSDVQLNDTYYGARVRLLADEEGLHAVWCQYHGDDGWPSTWSSADYGIIWYRFSDDSGVTWTDEFRVSQNEHIPPIDLPDMGANHVKLAEYSAGFCAMWQDKRDGNIDLYMRNHLVECPADFDGDGDVDTADLLFLLGAWGTPDGDVDGDGDTDTADLLDLLGAWGECP